MSDLKTIKYRGGIAEFVIPSHWREEYEPEGGGTFCEDVPDSGTLRLNVVTCESKDTPAEQMAEGAFNNGIISSTTNGFPIQREEATAEEDGERLHIVSWKVAIPVPPRSLRLAIFTHTVLEEQMRNPAVVEVIHQIDTSIRGGRYSQTAGIAGMYDHKSPATPGSDLVFGFS